MKMNEYQAAQILGLTGQINNTDIKRAYRQKAGQYHPDRNPAGADMMKLINAAYKVLKNIDGLNVWENETLADYPETLSQVLNDINGLDGLIIEVCGLWVWVTGKTKFHKEKLKEAGFKWAKNKGAWFFRPDTVKSTKRMKPWEMDKIRETYGSIKTTVKTQYLGAY